VHTISPTSALPQITDPVIIDGPTQPGYAGVPLIEIDGSGAGATTHGLLITAGASTVRGLIINRFDGNGIELDTNGCNLIAGNYIGTNATGTAAAGNHANGVAVGGTAGNHIGGTTTAGRNIVSGNGAHGIALFGNSSGNLVRGN
jgi:parallel beta-helix repeat protein